MDPSQFPPEYLAENNSQQLLNVIIAFGVLETVFFVLFVTARTINKTVNGVDFWLMPMAYITCFSHVIIISRLSSHGLSYSILLTATHQSLSSTVELAVMLLP